jgi:hypothetical protein
MSRYVASVGKIVDSPDSRLSNCAEIAEKPLRATILAELPARHINANLPMMLSGKLVGY